MSRPLLSGKQRGLDFGIFERKNFATAMNS
jgi:hypothetical protein